MNPVEFEHHYPDVGTMRLRGLDLPGDANLLHDWVNRDHARFWGMQGTSLEDVLDNYRKLQESGHAQAYLGWLGDQPAFLLEVYDPGHDIVGQHYPVEPGDVGMHFLTAPPTRHTPGFTRAVISTILAFLFRHPATQRVVVEPDVRNARIHPLNRWAGFVYEREIPLPHKQAHLAFCQRRHFLATQDKGTP
ncbi:GNAT family N-acetyltransferase [Paludibacterium paludis]|uniref:Alcaligin biosynthesis protein n=1 Tax=Paludibacterium paludis TaxID=1225769 RepID=A0A918P4Y5_9NEIS|nr:GNAT family N-acetyltransferase [Paludibacterium paludis]GGY20166.1 alcaligin biosynthesis protein [Paludibacterium paludis]